ncbi:MAG TPA: hypothetical protein VHS09_14830 [Polyangiaceae bacterium]|nr:hypothetical protein [Polyangiaceae bacterium]
MLLSAVVALACVLASARRLAWAVSPTSLDPAMLLAAVADRESWFSLRDAVASSPEASWEGELFQALAERNPRSRDALVTERLLELDWTAQRWGRVPRVCASIATSAGFLFGCIALLQGLSLPAEEGSAPALGLSLFAALNSLTLGLAGTAFCVAVHVRARRVVRERHHATERLVARLLELASG